MTPDPLLLAVLGLPMLALFPVVRNSLGRGAANGLLAAGVSIGLGVGLSGAAYWLWRIFFTETWPGFVLAEGCVVLALLAAAVRSRRDIPASADRSWSTGDWALVAAIAGITLVSVAYFIAHHLHVPHGEWDAWAVWNLKARFLVRGGAHWTDLFTTAITHSSYPLLIPAAVARLWSWTGSEAPVAGALVAAAFTYASPLVIVGSLARLRGWTPALWGGLIVLAALPHSIYGAFQVADVPYGFFILMVVVFIALDVTSREQSRFAAAAGVAVGLAGLVKDEGLPFMLCVAIAYVGYQLVPGRALLRHRAARVALFVAGALPFWMLLYWMRTSAPAGGMASALSNPQLMSTLTDVGRHTVILRAFLTTMWGWAGGWFVGVVPIFAVALCLGGWGLDRRLYAPAGFAVVVLMATLATYYAAYVVSPYELRWHMATSLHRILVHIWPTFVWLFCLVVSFDPDRRRETAATPGAHEVTPALPTPP